MNYDVHSDRDFEDYNIPGIETDIFNLKINNKYKNCYKKVDRLFQFKQNDDESYWHLLFSDDHQLGINDTTGNLFLGEGDNSNCNYTFDFDFDEDGNFILSPSSDNEPYINKNKVVRFQEWILEQRINSPFYSFSAFDKNDLHGSYPIKLYRLVDKPSSWEGQHYRKVYKQNEFNVNDTFVFEHDAIFKEEIPNFGTEERIKNSVFGFDDGKFTHIQVTNNQTEEFIYNKTDFAQFNFYKVENSDLYFINVKNLGYICAGEYLTHYAHSLEVKFVDEINQATKFSVECVNSKFLLTADFNDKEAATYYLVPTPQKDSIKYIEPDETIPYESSLMLLPQDTISRIDVYFGLYKLTNMEDVTVHKIDIFGDNKADRAQEYALSVKIELEVPAANYDRIKHFGNTLHYYMNYSFNDGEVKRQELNNIKVEKDEAGNESLRLSIVFRNIPLKDIDMKFKAYASYSVVNEQVVMYDSLKLNNGEGYTIREMANIYIAMYTNNPAEHQTDIKPHIRALRALANYGLGGN